MPKEATQRRPKEVRECDKGCKEDIVFCSPEWGGGSQKRPHTPPPKRPEETIGDQGKPENARSEKTRECEICEHDNYTILGLVNTQVRGQRSTAILYIIQQYGLYTCPLSSWTVTFWWMDFYSFCENPQWRKSMKE